VIELQNFVGGQWTDTAFDTRAEIIDPSTGEVFASAPVSGEAEVDAAFAAAADAFPGWRCCGSPTRWRPGPISS
jgi:betaine-aldehyde dehydrogenase